MQVNFERHPDISHFRNQRLKGNAQGQRRMSLAGGSCNFRHRHQLARCQVFSPQYCFKMFQQNVSVRYVR